jgi:hypothetical protein
MKSFLATTAVVLLMGGSAYAAPVQFNAYQSQASDIDASKFIGQTVYASKTDISAEQKVTGANKDWDNIGDINEVVLGRDGAVKAVVLGVGGFLGMGEKNVAVSMNDIKFVKNGDGADDYFLVVTATKEALNAAPAFKTPDDVKAAMDDARMRTNDTAANTTMTTPAVTNDDNAANTMAKTDMAKPADTASSTMMKADKTTDQTMAKPAGTDATTTASTTTDSAVKSTMDEARARLARPDVNRDGYMAAKAAELTADKLQGARVYGAKDEDVGEINRLVMNDNGQVKLFVLDIGGFLGIGEHEIAVTPDEVNIVRDAKGQDFRVYIDANKDALKAQPEYKTQ